MEDALPVSVQRLNNWDGARAEEMTAYIRVVRGILCFITRIFMKGLHSDSLR